MEPKELDWYQMLCSVMEEFPELVYDSKGYAEIPDEVMLRNQVGVLRVTCILKSAVKDFVRFQNFKPRKDGSIAVRCQTRWSEGFTGVSYFALEDFKRPN